MTDRMQVAQRANVPPFHVMDLLAAAPATAAVARRPGQPRRRPAVDGCPEGGPGRGQAAARRGAARLHGRDRGARAARGDRRPPSSYVGHRRRRRRRRRHHRIVGRVPARVPRRVRGGRPRGDGPARLPLPTATCSPRLGCEVVELDCGPETRFQPTVRAARRARRDRSHGLVLASPGQPDRHDAAARRARRDRRGGARTTGVRLISDEIYHGITYPGGRPRLRGQTGRAGRRRQLVLQVLLDDRLADRLDAGARRPAPTRSTCWPATSPSARRRSRSSPRSRAFTDAYAELRRPRRALRRQPSAPAGRAAASSASTGSPRPTARSTSTPTSSHLTDDSLRLAPRLLDEAGVAVAPGIDFDTRRGDEFVRLSFAGSGEEISAGLDRLGDWLG